MGCNTNLKSSAGKAVRSGALFLLGSLALVSQSLAQERVVPISPSEPTSHRVRAQVSQMSDAEAQRFLFEALSLRLPAELNDDVYLLAKSRSHLALPELIAHLREARQDPSSTAEYIHTLADVIAYAANEAAVESLLELASSDGERFGRYIGRLLDYSYGRKNPFSLAYHAINRADAASADYVIAWVEQSVTIEQNPRAWAEAIVERNKGVPSDDALANDPIVSRLSGAAPEALKKELSKIARESRGRPDRQ